MELFNRYRSGCQTLPRRPSPVREFATVECQVRRRPRLHDSLLFMLLMIAIPANRTDRSKVIDQKNLHQQKIIVKMSRRVNRSFALYNRVLVL